MSVMRMNTHEAGDVQPWQDSRNFICSCLLLLVLASMTFAVPRGLSDLSGKESGAGTGRSYKRKAGELLRPSHFKAVSESKEGDVKHSHDTLGMLPLPAMTLMQLPSISQLGRPMKRSSTGSSSSDMTGAAMEACPRKPDTATGKVVEQAAGFGRSVTVTPPPSLPIEEDSQARFTDVDSDGDDDATQAWDHEVNWVPHSQILDDGSQYFDNSPSPVDDFERPRRRPLPGPGGKLSVVKP